MNRIYQYGARSPLEEPLTADGRSVVEEQLLRAHRYYNGLVEAERARRVAVKEILQACEREMSPEDAKALEAAKRAKRAAIEAVNRKYKRGGEAWGRERSLEDVRALEEIKAAHRAVVEAVRAKYERERTPEEDRELEGIKEHMGARHRQLRRDSGVYPGTYLLVDEAFGKACAAKPKAGDKPVPWEHRPHFRRWDRTGRLGIADLGRPLTVAAALAGTDTRLRIERVPDPPESRKQLGSRRAGRRAIVRMRVASEGPGCLVPVWGAWPVTLHRLPPLDARIRTAWMQRIRIGPDYRWQLCLTTDAPPVTDVKVDPDRKGVVAVDLGWRVRPDGVRYGFWRDDSGGHGELLLPRKGARGDGRNVREVLEHAHSIRSIRDIAFNEFRDRLRAWLAEYEHALPDWLVKDAASLRQWKSADRLYRLVWRWRRSRLPGDESIWPALEAWLIKDRHLNSWASHETRRALGWRDEVYRQTAIDFARRYATVVVEKFDLKEVSGRRGLKEDATDAEKVRADRASSVRHAVAPGRFRDIVKEAFGSRGGRVVEYPAAWTTIDCCACGKRLPWDPAPQVDHRCDGCGVVVDQDDQACCNLLAKYASGDVPTGSPDPLAKPKLSRYERFQLGKARKRAREEAERVRLSQEDVEERENSGPAGAAVEMGAHARGR